MQKNTPHIRPPTGKAWGYLWARDVGWSKVWGMVISSGEKGSSKPFCASVVRVHGVLWDIGTENDGVSMI